MPLRPRRTNNISIVGSVTLHRNLSFEDYFSTYSRERDGAVRLATYSFKDVAFGDIHKMMPFSTLYVDENYVGAATKFVRRFPLYVVYIVKGLHTKCIFFEESGRLLVGSQNLFTPHSDFEELACEFEVSPGCRDKAIELAFEFEEAAYLRVAYEAKDVNIYGAEKRGVAGRAYLPCHREGDYWAAIGKTDYAEGDSVDHYIYVILEYRVNGGSVYLAFDRLYQFCGELSNGAVRYLEKSRGFRSQEYAFLGAGSGLSRGAPFKDQFSIYHPIARDNKPTRALYIAYDD
ncbi:hypothetical protein ACQKFX_21340 [Cupriavidus metallidurans]|uniref:hypothetical protein n=1 Tax=Cupriavidus metallidurans TaxID=119219 RepID=UPI003CFBF245